jgi:hypothetical protein
MTFSFGLQSIEKKFPGPGEIRIALVLVVTTPAAVLAGPRVLAISRAGHRLATLGMGLGVILRAGEQTLDLVQQPDGTSICVRPAPLRFATSISDAAESVVDSELPQGPGGQLARLEASQPIRRRGASMASSAGMPDIAAREIGELQLPDALAFC